MTITITYQPSPLSSIITITTTTIINYQNCQPSPLLWSSSSSIITITIIINIVISSIMTSSSDSNKIINIITHTKPHITLPKKPQKVTYCVSKSKTAINDEIEGDAVFGNMPNSNGGICWSTAIHQGVHFVKMIIMRCWAWSEGSDVDWWRVMTGWVWVRDPVG